MSDFSVGCQITLYVGYNTSVSNLLHTVATNGTRVIATEVGTTSAAKVTAKTTSKAAFEAAISGTPIGAHGVAFGINVLLEAPSTSKEPTNFTGRKSLR